MKRGVILHSTLPPTSHVARWYKMCARTYLNGDGLGKGTHFLCGYNARLCQNDGTFYLGPLLKCVNVVPSFALG